MLFNLLYHKHLIDMQSGLRFIPEKITMATSVDGNGFDFDINMLVQAIRQDYTIYEIEIGHARIKKMLYCITMKSCL